MRCPKLLPRVVIKPKSVMGEWVGMNPAAAEEVGFPYDVPPNEVWVSIAAENRYETALHELVEYALMACRKFHYKPAHAATDSIVLKNVLREPEG